MPTMNLFDTLNWVDALSVCLVATLLGVWLAKKQAQAYHRQGQGKHPAVTFSDYGDMRFLHLGSPAVQGSMKLSQPFEIHLEYVQRMMAWLLFVPLEQVHQQRAMQLGLGAASLTKFCDHTLKMNTLAVELNPQVIETCRTWFHLPADHARLQVLQGDAADLVKQTEWLKQIDVLQVDLYDAEAKCPVLDSEAFYRDCHALLTPTGCLVINVFGRASNVHTTLQTLTRIFGADALWAFTPTVAGNSVVLAFAQPTVRKADELRAQAQAIEARWPLPATSWLRALSPQRET
jgi:spermidine synthase